MQNGLHDDHKKKVACVGDSITAGVQATDRAHSYPSQLQALLGNDYAVTNLGSSAAMMQRRGTRPFVRTAMYSELLAYEWDIVIIMLV